MNRFLANKCAYDNGGHKIERMNVPEFSLLKNEFVEVPHAICIKCGSTLEEIREQAPRHPTPTTGQKKKNQVEVE